MLPSPINSPICNLCLPCYNLKIDVCLMVFNAPFNNISVISWQSVLLVEKTTDLSQVTDKLYHIMLCTSPLSRFELPRTVVIGTDCIGSCKSNYHTIKATTVLWKMDYMVLNNMYLSFNRIFDLIFIITSWYFLRFILFQIYLFFNLVDELVYHILIDWLIVWFIIHWRICLF
jgi:hypothetical protein